jgi:hypothetical protein
MNVDSHICQHHQHTKVYQPTNPITWIEMLPKDCIGCIRKFLAKQDFDKVLFQLQIATNSERQWIIDCAANPPEPCRVGEEAGALGPRARHRRGPCGPSLAPVQLYIEMYLSHAPNLSKTWTEMMPAFRDCRWTGPEKNFHSASPIFQKLWDFIELHIGVVHQMIQNIKRSYRQSVAVPEDFIRRNGVYSSFVWPDTKAGFIQYINEDPVVGNYRNVIKGLLEKILSSGGWLRTIRYRSKEYKKELYTVCY